MTRSPLTLRRIAAIGGISSAAALALVATQPALADDHAEEEVEMTKGEAELAELLEGRVAGEPQNCIRSRINDRLRVIDDTALVYGRGNTIYVQRTRRPERIDSRDTLVSRRFSASQICRQDIVTTIDPLTGIFTGAVFFEEFIPYTRVDDGEG